MRLLIESQRSWEFGWEIPRIAWCHNGNYVWLVLVTIQIRTERITTTTTTSTTKQPSSGLSQWEIPFHRFWWYKLNLEDIPMVQFPFGGILPIYLWYDHIKKYRCEVVKLQNCFNFLLFSQDSSPFSPRCFLHTHTYTPSRRDLCHTSPKVPTERLNAVTVEV